MRRGLAAILAALLVLLCGCGPDETAPQEPAPQEPVIPSEPEAPAEPEQVSPVYADWSKLDPGSETETIGGTYWDAPLDHLEPDDGYGLLVPYIGRELRVIWEGGGSWDQYYYGLATADGQVVTEAVYDQIQQLAWGSLNWADTPLPVYVLRTTVDGPDQEPLQLCAVAAQDGSWCTDQVYLGVSAIGPDRLLLADQEQRTWFCDLEGNITATAVKRPLDEIWSPWWYELMNISGPLSLMPAADGSGGYFVDFDSGLETAVPEAQFGSWSGDSTLLHASANITEGYLNRKGEWVIPPEYYRAGDFYFGYAAVQKTESGPYELIDESGRTVLTVDGILDCIFIGDTVCWLNTDDGRILKVLDADLREILPEAVGGTTQYGWNAISWQDDAGKGWYWDGGTVYALPDGGYFVENCGDGWAFLTRMVPDTSQTQIGIYDPVKGQWNGEQITTQNYRLLTTENGPYLLIGIDGGTLWDAHGRKLFSGQRIEQPVAGLFPVVDGAWTGLRDTEGEWVLRIPLDTAGD